MQNRALPGEFITVGTKKLHYKKAGSGPPVIVLHGASGNLLDWTHSRFDELARRYTVLAFDRPGLGYSDAAEDHSLSAQAALMREAAELLGMPRATLIGHSFGGSVALAWALDAPDRVDNLVLLSAPSQVWPGSAGRLYDIANLPVLGYALSVAVPILASERRIQQAVATIFAPQGVPAGYLEHVRPELSVQPQTFRNNTSQVGQLKRQIKDMVPRYGTLKMPIELIHGTADEVVPAEIHSKPFAAMQPNVRLTLLDGVGHMPHHVSPEALDEALARVIST